MYSALQYPARFPAYSAMLVDPDDNLWIEEYRAPGDTQTRWRIYSPAGLLIGTVLTAQSFQLLEAGRNYVLGVWKDQNDVEYVQMYSLLKAAGRPGTGGASL